MTRIAVIGAGIMGADHARIIATELPGAELRWICDADEARARSVADATGARHVSKDPLAAIEADHVDAVLIASPDHTHADLTLACLRVRKPVTRIGYSRCSGCRTIIKRSASSVDQGQPLARPRATPLEHERDVYPLKDASLR